MKMKYVVGAMIIIFSVFMSGVFVWGFVQKQSKEANLPTPAQTTPPATSTPSTSSNQPQTTTPTAPAQKSFTAAEVASHNSPSNCWLIIHGNVYDVGSFLDQHPGGSDVIIPYCGKDATQAFETQGGRRSTHSQSARQLLAQYQVGTL